MNLTEFELISVADKKELELTVQSIDSSDTVDHETKSPATSEETDASSDQQNSEVSSTTDTAAQNQSTESPVKQNTSDQSSIPEPSNR